MSFHRGSFCPCVAIAFLGLSVALASLQGQERPATQPAEGHRHASLGHGNHGISHLDGAKFSQKYKSYADPKPRVVDGEPVNATTVSKGVEKLIEAELGDTKCKARSGTCMPVKDKWLCTYQLQYEGIPLAKTSDAMCIIRNDGHAMVFRERSVPRKVNSTKATVDAKNAVEVGQKAFRDRSKSQKADAAEPTLEIWVDGEQSGHLCWTFAVTNGSLVDPIAAQYWIAAAGEARVVAVENLIYHAHAGTVTGTVWATTPLQPTQTLPLAFLDVTCSEREGRARPTGLGGEYSFVPTRDSGQVRATLSGAACMIENHGGELVLSRTQSGKGSGPINLDFNAQGEFEIAQVTAFYWTTLARDFAKDFLLPSHLWQLTTRINHNASCNAGFSAADVSINFYRAGGGCQNTASSDIVVHEYGHAIDYAHGGILDGGYSEGFGDALAILVTRQPLIGRDLKGAGTFLRDGRNVLSFSPHSEPHLHGQIYAGFTWELLQQLKKRSVHHADDDAFEVAKWLILAADTLNPKDIPDAVQLAFLADDDDGDLTNGSPHFAELAAAADSRKIPRPPDPEGAPDPRHGYLGGRGTHHLAASVGTAVYSWNSTTWLATLRIERTDGDFWYYCEKERPEYRWALARKANAGGQFAVWLLPGTESRGDWVLFHLAHRVTPQSLTGNQEKPNER